MPAFEEVFRTWLLDEYLQHLQKEIGSAPQARWEASGFLPQMPDSLEQLDLLLLQGAKGRRVHQDGIYFEGKRYLDLTLAAYVGEDVTIRYDPRDMAEIRVFYHDALSGIEKRLARYPQLYSRVGFVHQFHSLSTEEVHFILEHKWQQIGVRLQPDDFSDMEAVATVIRITGGNFRLIHRLCTQIERILHINEIRMVTKEVVEAAREQLVIGQV